MAGLARFPLLLTLASVVPGTGCVSHTLDVDDRQALFVDARVRKTIRPEAGDHPLHIEGAWIRASGSDRDLDYSIHTLNAGAGVEGELGQQGWSAVAGGLSLQDVDLDSSAIGVNHNAGLGLYAALEGGWHATTVVEPYARIEAALYFVDFGTTLSIEAGARLHVVDHAALFVGWRYTRFNIRDVDHTLSVDEVDLDASGLALGLSFTF